MEPVQTDQTGRVNALTQREETEKTARMTKKQEMEKRKTEEMAPECRALWLEISVPEVSPE